LEKIIFIQFSQKDFEVYQDYIQSISWGVGEFFLNC
jgi:hypothetical protein